MNVFLSLNLFRCHSIFRVSCFLIDNWQIKKSDKLKIEKKSNMNISIIFRNLRNTYGEVEILYQRNNWYAIFTHRFVEFFFNFQSPSIFIEFDSMKRDRYRKVERIGRHLIYVEFPRPMINLSRVKPQSFPNHTRNKVAHPRRTYNLNLRQPNDTPLGVEYYVTIDDSRMHG